MLSANRLSLQTASIIQNKIFEELADFDYNADTNSMRHINVSRLVCMCFFPFPIGFMGWAASELT